MFFVTTILCSFFPPRRDLKYSGHSVCEVFYNLWKKGSAEMQTFSSKVMNTITLSLPNGILFSPTTLKMSGEHRFLVIFLRFSNLQAVVNFWLENTGTHSKYPSSPKVMQGARDVIDSLVIGHCGHCTAPYVCKHAFLAVLCSSRNPERQDRLQKASDIHLPVFCFKLPQGMIMAKLTFVTVFVETNKIKQICINRSSPCVQQTIYQTFLNPKGWTFSLGLDDILFFWMFCSWKRH